MSFFEIKNIAFEIVSYKISYVEFIGTFFGLISVYFASRANILTWSTGIFNELFLFLLFFQVQLYADMFLQVYFFIVTLYGWYSWKSKKGENVFTTLRNKERYFVIICFIIGTILFASFFSCIHIFLPEYFTQKAAFPIIDSIILVLSVIASILLALKKIENWILWITVDIICVFLYYVKEVYFLSLEYLLFLLIAFYGFHNWKKKLIYD